jgi:hypothetical protein
MTRSALVPTILALCAVGSAAALDHELASAPYVFGAALGTVPEYYVGVTGALESKVTDDYRVVADDAALALDGQFRVYGLGLAIKTDWSVGQSTDISRAGNKNNPGELLRSEVKLDWALEIRAPGDGSIPLLQIIPHLNWVTYPNQRDQFSNTYDNYLKDRQRWLGVDAWWALPWAEGVEIGAGLEYNISTSWRATRGSVGAREFNQYNAVDLAFWQLVNMADSEYRGVVGGVDSSGLTTIAVGGRATVPMFAEDFYGFVELEASHWMDKDVRENIKGMGQDSGDVVMSFGLIWLPK